VNASTATATTATAKSYTGRFAPSPTGRLHLGSVLAAVGSYLDARHHGGRWLVRIEDLDRPRVIPGSSDEILRTLETLNLFWDGDVTYQSTRLPRYAAALQQLRDSGRTFECSCSRQTLTAQGDTGYPGTCREGPRRAGPTATRFRIGDGEWLEFTDRIQGVRRQHLAPLGDVVIRRRDGLIAYQLAVVVDDADQAITDVVRGADLLGSTAWQIQLQRALGYRPPRYAHLPVVTAPDGGKLAKSRFSLPPDLSTPSQVLLRTLVLLEQRPPAELAQLEPGEVLKWAILNWNPAPLHQIAAVPAQ
jgi:glutamyl-Q tRNA(Asp) synthetase